MRAGGVNNMKNYKIAVAGTGYVGLSIATLLSQHHQVTAVDIVPEKVEMINNRAKLFCLTVERPEEIDIRRAEEARDRAEEQLRQKQSIVEYHRSQAALARAMTRLRVSKNI